jgi:hypothetical protein
MMNDDRPASDTSAGPSPPPPAIPTASLASLPPPPPPGATHVERTPMEHAQEKATLVLSYGRKVSMTWLDQARKALAKHVRDIVVSTDERDRLVARGIQDPDVQCHFAWRRSLLWFITVPTTFTAILATINQLDREAFQSLSKLGVLMVLVYVATLWAIPASVVMAARTWDRPRTSRRFLLAGFLIAFPYLILIGLVPFSWWINLEEGGEKEMMIQRYLFGLIGALALFMLLLPAVLSLLPGAIRACVRIKVLFPQSIVSGWLLITVTPIYALFLITIFIVVNQVAGNFLLILGLAALVLAPVAYLANTPLFIRPLWSETDRARIERAQWVYFGFLMAAMLLMGIYALTASVFDKKLVGFSSSEPLMSIWSFGWHAFKFVMDYLGRSLFITSIAVDLFLLINVSVWQNTRAFERTEAAAGYEKTLNELGEVLVRD